MKSQKVVMRRRRCEVVMIMISNNRIICNIVIQHGKLSYAALQCFIAFLDRSLTVEL